MKGYVARKGNRWYAVIYEGTDPITGKERRSWHPAGCERADAERLASRLASERDGADDGARSLSFGAFLGAPSDAVRRGLISRNVALVAHAPSLRSIPRVEQPSSTAEELQAFLRTAAGHRLFAAFWVAAFTGMRRGELLGLRWEDFNEQAATVDQPRADRHRLRAARDPRRDLQRPPAHRPGPDHGDGPSAWRSWQAELRAAGIETAGWMFTHGTGEPIHPHAISQTFERIARRAGVPVIRLHGLRHTHGALLISAGVPVKVVSERLGHATPAFTSHLPARDARHAGRGRRVFERLVAPPAGQVSENSEKTREKPRMNIA